MQSMISMSVGHAELARLVRNCVTLKGDKKNLFHKSMRQSNHVNDAIHCIAMPGRNAFGAK